MTDDVMKPAARGGPLSPGAQALTDAVKAMPKPSFAVLDGAQFADLPATLGGIGLSARSLFLNHADEEIERAGPWLVPLDDDQAAALVVEAVADMPAAVFWSCPGGEDSLHRHLRTINLVVVPLPHQPEPTEEDTSPGPIMRDETVTFRHADADVMASVMPLLDEMQFARIFGPAIHILMDSPRFGGLRRAPRPDDLPITPAGLLRLTPDQMDALERSRAEASHRKVATFLRDVDPASTAGIDDRQLDALVRESERNGRELGITSERALGYWAFMMLGSRGRIGRDPVVRQYLGTSDGSGSPNDKVYLLMDRLAALPPRMAR